MKFLFKLFSFIPSPAKIWVLVGLGFMVLVVLGSIVYKIDKRGFDRCENRFAVASVELKDQARKEIIEAEKRYDKIKAKISNIQGADPVAGPRTTVAIDSLR